MHFHQVIMDGKNHSLLAAKVPPVMNPDIIAFHASSFCRHPFTAQSNVENIPPHTPKFPPVTGARAFIVEIAPTRRSPCYTSAIVGSWSAHRARSRGENRRARGEFRAPLIPCQTPPPIAPIEKAPPKSLRITHGLWMVHVGVYSGLPI